MIALLFALYPANIHMALNPEPFVAEGLSRAALYARLPMQFVFMVWVWWAARPGRDYEHAPPQRHGEHRESRG